MSFADIIGPLDPAQPAPLYHQLREAVRDAIARRALSAHDALPPERDLAHALDVSRITVRKALDGLVADGLLTRRQGAGTFVAGRVEKSFSRLTSFSEDMAARGWTPSSVWISRAQGPATPEESLMLNLSPGVGVYRFQRIRYADETPMALEHALIPAACLPSMDAVETSLYAALEAAGRRPMRALQRLRAVAFTEDQAAQMQTTVGAPGLLIERRGFDATGQAVELTRSWYRGDAYDFIAELSESPADAR
jgi:GntR family transcriptional regulator